MNQDKALSENGWNYFAKLLFFIQTIGCVVFVGDMIGNWEATYMQPLMRLFFLTFLMHMSVSAFIEKDKIDKIFSIVDVALLVITFILVMHSFVVGLQSRIID